MKKNLKKLWILLPMLVAILAGCEHDLIKNEGQTSRQKITFKDVSIDDLISSKTAPKLIEKISFLENKQKNLNRGGEIDSTYNFTIDHEKGKYIEVADIKSYTFPIYRYTSDNKVENIIFTYKNDELFEISTAKYPLTKEELDQTSYNATIVPTEVQILQSKVTVPKITITILMCDNDGSGGDGPAHNAGENCTCSDHLYLVTITIITNSPNGTGVTFGGLNGNNSSSNGTSGANGDDDDLGNNSPPYYGGAGVTTPVTGLSHTEALRRKFFRENILSTAQENFFNALSITTKNSIYEYLSNNSEELDAYNQESIDFALELINSAITETNQADVNNLVGLSIAMQNHGENTLNDAFMISIDQYIDASMIDPIVIQMISAHYTAQCAILRYNHQDWPEWKIKWEASKDLLHITLDALGLIPVYGEVADLANGVLYKIDGDNVNATLSLASAVPIAGWATISTKYGIKVINAVNDINTKVRLTWTITNNIVSFGAESTCRAQLRKILGLAVGNPLIAHHIMPISLQTEVVIQNAAKSSNAFHLNEALNGLALNTLQHSGNHANYTTAIRNKLIAYNNLNPNATPLESYNYLITLINQIKAWVIAHPNTNINLITLP